MIGLTVYRRNIHEVMTESVPMAHLGTPKSNLEEQISMKREIGGGGTV